MAYFSLHILQGRRQAGPPFIFTKEDSDGPEGILSNTLLLDSPDLPGQDELAPWADTDLEWIPEDPESTMRFYEGWRGLWADKLMAKSDKRKPLGQVTITQWTTTLGRKQWAVVLKLKAKRLETYIPTMNYPDHPAMQRMGPPKRCISQYEIEATVLRIFVTQSLIDSGELNRLVIVPAYSNNSVASTENEAPPSPGSIVYFEEL
ncbi:hypothetical protein FRB93_006878 [Tulasnella sp. JGI-2019a]|nr:hypothetical protein FRB93_006878 [Tulasnella sp. JGI-2019a]